MNYIATSHQGPFNTAHYLDQKSKTAALMLSILWLHVCTAGGRREAAAVFSEVSNRESGEVLVLPGR